MPGTFIDDACGFFQVDALTPSLDPRASGTHLNWRSRAKDDFRHRRCPWPTPQPKHRVLPVFRGQSHWAAPPSRALLHFETDRHLCRRARFASPTGNGIICNARGHMD